MQFKPRRISIVQSLNLESPLSGRCYLHFRWYFTISSTILRYGISLNLPVSQSIVSYIWNSHPMELFSENILNTGQWHFNWGSSQRLWLWQCSRRERPVHPDLWYCSIAIFSTAVCRCSSGSSGLRSNPCIQTCKFDFSKRLRPKGD